VLQHEFFESSTEVVHSHSVTAHCALCASVLAAISSSHHFIRRERKKRGEQSQELELQCTYISTNYGQSHGYVGCMHASRIIDRYIILLLLCASNSRGYLPSHKTP